MIQTELLYAVGIGNARGKALKRQHQGKAAAHVTQKVRSDHDAAKRDERRDRSRRPFPRRLRAADDHAPTLRVRAQRVRALRVPGRVWVTRVWPSWLEWRLIVGFLVLMAVAAYTGIRLGQDIVEKTTTAVSATSDAEVL